MIEKIIKYSTSPLIFFQPDSQTIKIIEANSQNRINKISPLVYQVLWFFLEEKTLEEALSHNLDKTAILSCIKEGLILETSKQPYQSAMQWETNNWNRAAYLMFSQANLKYAEKIDQYNPLQLINQRRSIITTYNKEKAYPDRFLPKGNIIIDLIQTPNNNNSNFESIKNRKSIRGFSKKPVSFSDFSDILNKSTNNTREAESSKINGDPYFFLNSFYSWLTIYIAVQAVEGVDRGIYYFNQEKQQLIQVKKGLTDHEIEDCIQKQIWIKGGGFCLFIGAQWERYAWIYRHSRAYINLLIQLGEISQEFLINSYEKSLGGWMTPAVTESKANQLCQLTDDSIEILYFMKFGHPPDVKIHS